MMILIDCVTDKKTEIEGRYWWYSISEFLRLSKFLSSSFISFFEILNLLDRRSHSVASSFTRAVSEQHHT